ncbi:MAG: hypothetical protein J2P49_00570 [Methylocapsa sp.]|nr:hypothetical protein [Methylocapsa sp.]
MAPPERRREPFPFLFLACFLAHAAILAVLLFQNYFHSPAPAAAEEIPVEIVAEIPPEPAIKPLPPPPDHITPPVVKPETPPEKVPLDDVKIAHDAPVSGNAAQTQKSDTERETRAPQTAPPPKLAALQPPEKKPEQEKAAAPVNEKPAEASSPSPDEKKLPNDEPDAEALEKAQPPVLKPKDKKAPKPSKDTAAEGRKVTVAQQLAALAPAPSFSLGAKAKAAPIGGGTEKASYESLLMGLISRQLRSPHNTSHLVHSGDIGLFVDELGNLTHQALYHASGDPALDAAWIAAVRRAAPFPAPPRGLPHGFLLHFTDRDY